MSTFIKLTHRFPEHGDLRLNPIFMDEYTEVYCMGMDYSWEVQETPDEIIKLSETKKYFTTFNKEKE